MILRSANRLIEHTVSSSPKRNRAPGCGSSLWCNTEIIRTPRSQIEPGSQIQILRPSARTRPEIAENIQILRLWFFVRYIEEHDVIKADIQEHGWAKRNRTEHRYHIARRTIGPLGRRSIVVPHLHYECARSITGKWWYGVIEQFIN